MSLRAGERLGPYEIQRALGAGGMGEVYLANDARLDRLVAIKVLPHKTAGDPDFRDRFVREARLVSRLTHPNLCTVFDVGSHGDADFFVMEYVEGETLAARLARGPLAVDDAMRYAIQIADGLAKAHASGVIHRDLKPGNVMITPDGVAKILDFGLAKQVAIDEQAPTALASVTAAGIVMGTIAYMSPEQTQGQRADVRSDIFCFGVMLYEMLTGQRPFDGSNLISTLRRINDEQPSPVRARRPELSAALESIVATALEKDPDRRFQSAGELGSRLREAAAELSARQAGAVRSRTTRRAGLGIAAAALAGVALLAVPRWLALTGTSQVQSQATPTTAIEWVRQGENLMKRYDRTENVDQAVAAFSSALALDPKSAVAHAGLSMAYAQKLARTPDPQLARLASESARQALTANPDLAVSHLAHGIILLRTGKTEDALKELLLARDADPLNAKVARWLGEYFVAVNDGAQAEAAFKRATEVQPDDWAAYGALGSFLYRSARYEEALAAWEHADQLAVDNVVILRNLAAAYHQLDRTDEGIAKLQRALEIQPEGSSYSNLGTMRFFQGRYGDAAQAFEKAVEVNPTNYLYWGNLGDAYRWIPGSTEKATQAYARGISLALDRLKAAPENVELQSTIAVYLVKSGQVPQALQRLAQVETMRRTPGSFFKSMMVYELAGQRDKALRDLEAALDGGYAHKEIENEPELITLRSDPRFHRLIVASGR